MGLLQAHPDDFLRSKVSAHDLSDAVVEAKIQQRAKAKKAQNFARADEIRNWLKEKGIVLDDGRQGTRWRRQK